MVWGTRNLRVGFDFLSAFSCAVTDAGVGRLPEAITTCTRLFLSRKATLRPEPLWVHPSGYLIAYPAVLLWNTRKIWLSGMSPVAAECTSAASAPAPLG